MNANKFTAVTHTAEISKIYLSISKILYPIIEIQKLTELRTDCVEELSSNIFIHTNSKEVIIEILFPEANLIQDAH